LHPWDGITEANYELGPKTKGTRTDIKELDESAKYSFPAKALNPESALLVCSVICS
jgi:hypothetical protein